MTLKFSSGCCYDVHDATGVDRKRIKRQIDELASLKYLTLIKKDSQKRPAARTLTERGNDRRAVYPIQINSAIRTLGGKTLPGAS